MAAIRRVAGAAVAAIDRRRPWRVLDRPVFIIAPPRSGSTYLFDVLAHHPRLASWPMEAHPAYLAARPLGHDRAFGDRWPPSYATEDLRRSLARELYLGRIRHWGRVGRPRPRWERLGLRPIRLLEKTPANVLRVEVLAALFPDARFVFLHRDAPGSIASLIEAWETPTEAHATLTIDGREVHWMMLAPPGWLDHLDDQFPARSAFQWRAGVEYPLAAFREIDPARWRRVAYEDLVTDPERHVRGLLEFLDLEPDPAVLAAAAGVGQAGRTSLSAPSADKWRERATEIEPLLPALAEVRAELGYGADP